MCFSQDSRWVTVSTLNGTSHVFPITPYGGNITVRTHTPSHVVNKLSRFHTSAGMEGISHSLSHSSIPSTGQSLSPPTMADTRDCPSHSSSINWNNPRCVPCPLPVHVNAMQLIKQPYLSPSGKRGALNQVMCVDMSLSLESTGTTLGSVSPHNHDNSEPFVTLAGPEAICVAALFTSLPDARRNGQTSTC